MRNELKALAAVGAIAMLGFGCGKAENKPAAPVAKQLQTQVEEEAAATDKPPKADAEAVKKTTKKALDNPTPQVSKSGIDH
ncbi:MAG: hypothetical protein GXP32_06045 [Kiritimatiellaeota bacterium]|nr:hypothetical protein [Kiritimatiellota bacterium]